MKKNQQETSDSSQLKIAFDANGFDGKYKVVVEAVQMFLAENPDIIVYLYGPIKVLRQLFKVIPTNLRLISATTIPQSAAPLQFRHYPNSSLVKSISSLKNNCADGLLSGNNSGQLLAAATLFLTDRKMKNNRPFFCASIPTSNPTGVKKMILFADCGANIFLTDKYYLQMTKTCIEYYRKLIDNTYKTYHTYSRFNPKVGLLNVGTEKEKGNEEIKAAYKILSTSPSVNFIGNVEPLDVFHGKSDIVICNGLIGNIFIKTIEASFIFLKEKIKQLFASKIYLVGFGIILKKKMDAVKKQYEASTFAYLLGLLKPVIKIHGNSNKKQILAGLNKICQVIIMEQLIVKEKTEEKNITQKNEINQQDESVLKETKQTNFFGKEATLNKKIPKLKFQNDIKIHLTNTHKNILAKCEKNVIELLKYLDIKPNNINLYIMALTHISWTRANKLPLDFNYERLEYSGDRAINFFVSEYLDRKFPNISQGEITKINSRIISNSNIANAARFVQITKYANFSSKVNLNNISTKILAAMFEAIIGAIQRDHKQSIKCQKKIKAICEKLIIQTALRQGVLENDNDYKSQLQEYLHNKMPGSIIDYRTLKTETKNKQIYHTECLHINGKKILCLTGTKKNACHQKIAKKILVKKNVISVKTTEY